MGLIFIASSRLIIIYMDATTVFSRKAEKYASYRWGYVQQAVETLLVTAGINDQSSIADIGAGTGMLTRALAGRAGKVYAIEPNAAMRRILERDCSALPGVSVLNASAEATTLPAHTLHLIAVGTAFNWFDPIPTRAEFHRILRPGGWLANLRNRVTSPDFGQAFADLYPPQTGTLEIMKGANTPLSFYLCDGKVQTCSFPFQIEETWPHFLGSLATASYAPDEDHPTYPAFEQGARALFEQFSRDGTITLHGVTELEVGQIPAK